MRGKGFLVAASFALLLVIGVSIYALRRTSAGKQAAPPPPPKPAVYAGSEVTLEGKVHAPAVQPVPAPADGRVESFHAEVGDEVYEGQILAIIKSDAAETEQERAELDLERAQTRVNNLEGALAAARLEASRAEADASRARAEAERTEKVYQRERMLLAEGATPRLKFERSEREYNEARTESEALSTLAGNAASRVEALQRDLDAARKTLAEKTQDLEDARTQTAAGEVRAPANGVLVGRRGVVGDEVDRSMPDLLQIATDLSRLEVILEPEPPVLARIKPGQQANVSVAEQPGETLPGTVKSTDQGKVTVEFANPNPLIRPGLTAHVRIVLE
jgi:HlyD family secretion protein